MAFCSNCGEKIDDGVKFCTSCGKAVGGAPVAQDTVAAPAAPVVNTQGANLQIPAKDKSGFARASLVLGIGGLGAWLLPLLGLPVTIVGLVTGVVGRKSSNKKMATVGLILSMVGLIATIINVSIGFYMGATAQSPGTFTLTGIPSEYNGKYALLEGWNDRVDIVGGQSFNIEGTSWGARGSRISNGRVSINVWDATNAWDDGNIVKENIVKYTGSHTFEGSVGIFNSESPDDGEPIAFIEFDSIIFSNGSATVSANSGTLEKL